MSFWFVFDNRSFLSAYFVKVNQNSQRLSQKVCWKKVKKAFLLWRCSAISTTLHVLILRVDCHCHGSLAQYVKSVRWPNGVITYLHHFATNLNHFITTVVTTYCTLEDYWKKRKRPDDVYRPPAKEPKSREQLIPKLSFVNAKTARNINVLNPALFIERLE